MLNEIECDLRLEKSEVNEGSTFVFTMVVRSYSSSKLFDDKEKELKAIHDR